MSEDARSGIRAAVSAGVFAGAVGGLATHYLSGDRLGIPAFVVALLLLGGVKGRGKLVALVVFGIVAGVVVAVFKPTGIASRSRTLPPPPSELAVSGPSIAFNSGDSFSYAVASSSEALDGGLLTITILRAEADNVAFSVRFRDLPPREQTLSLKEATLCSPGELKDGSFAVVGLGERIPGTVRKETVWSANEIFYTYDANNMRRASGSRTEAYGPEWVAVPAIEAYTAKVQRVDVGASKLVFVRWFSPSLRFAVRSRERRPEGTAITLFELHSYKVAGKEAVPPQVAHVDPAARQKPIEWMKKHTKFSETSQVVDDLIFQLHMGARESPGNTLRWVVGQTLTTDGKAYQLEWEDGDFSASEVSAQAGESASSLAFSIVE